MSSTSKTPNLGLNQWVLSDPFLMEDMNEDNRKIDAALAASPWVKLMDVTLREPASAVELNLADIDLSKFGTLRVYYLSDNNASMSYFRWNKLTSGYDRHEAIGGWQSAGGSCYYLGGYIDFELTSSNLIAHSLNEFYRQTYEFKPSRLTTIDLMPDSSGTASFPAGRRFILMGVRV